MLGVKYILTSTEVEGTKLLLVANYEDIEMYCHNMGMVNVPSVFVYENPDAFPRVYLTSSVETVSRDETLRALNTYDSEDIALVEEDIPGILDYRSGVAKIKSYSPNRIAIEAELDGSGLLVLSEVWYPGWKAFVDGKETEAIRTNYLLRGVYLGPGLHNVEWLFRPASWLYGRYVSLITMSLSVVLIASRLLLRRTKREDPAHNR